MTPEDFAKQAAEDRHAVAALRPPADLPGSPFEAAYHCQDALAAAVEWQAGPVAGYKLAVNGLAQQIQLQLPHPISGRIFGREVYDSGATLPLSAFQMLCVEPEIAAILGDEVETTPLPATRAETLGVIDRFHPAIELIDPRGNAMAPDAIPVAVALNVFNAGIVLGPGHVAPSRLDLTSMRVTLMLDGNVAHEVVDAAPQHPVDAVMWLLHHLAARGLKAEPGMIVMCGTHIPIWRLDPAVRRVEISMSGLGPVDFSLTG